MGRRALRKIDPELDLSRHWLDAEQLEYPCDPQDWFERTQPLELEVGSGKGLFLATASGGRPDHNFVGIEIARKYARYSAARLAKLERTNALVIHGDAQQLFKEGLTAASVTAVHVYFPDPWWKKRHRKRRIMNPEFIRQVIRVLRLGGHLHFWTDVQEYFDSALELLAEFPQLAGPVIPHEQPAQHDLDFRTHFERRMRLHREAVFRSEFRRVDSVDSSAEPQSPG